MGRPGRSAFLGLAAAALTVGVAAIALAGTGEYKNDFSTRAKAKQIKPVGGDPDCLSKWRKGKEDIRLSVANGSGVQICFFETPRVAPDALSNQDFRAELTLLESTTEEAREGASIGIAVRAGDGDYYSWEIQPGYDDPLSRGFVLRREPANPAQFPSSSSSGLIKGVGKRNIIRLRVAGNTVRAFINGTEVREIQDMAVPAPAGRRMQLWIVRGLDAVGKLDVAVDDLRYRTP